MNHLTATEPLADPTTAMDASDALSLNSLCDRRDAAMLSPFTAAEGLLAAGEEAAAGRDGDEPAAEPGGSN